MPSPNATPKALFAVILFFSYKPAGGSSCMDTQCPSGPGSVAQDVDPAGHNFRGTTLVFGEDRYRLFGSLNEHAMYPSSGSPDLPVATINGDAPVTMETGTWGAVKLLYR